MGIVVRHMLGGGGHTRGADRKKRTVVKIQASQGWENKLTWKTLKGQRRPGAWLSLSRLPPTFPSP